MPVTLQGSCHCQEVKFTVESNTPAPYQVCQCSICRKVGGYMGSVNIMGNYDTLDITNGKDKIKNYIAAKYDNGKKVGQCGSVRAFCIECSSMLWVHDDQWKQWVYPFASAIDTPLLKVPHGNTVKNGTDQEEDSPLMLCILRSSAPESVPVPEGSVVYNSYPPGKGIEDWHKKHKMWVE